MNNIRLLRNLDRTTIRGNFRTIQSALSRTKSDCPYLRLQLENMNGLLTAYCWSEGLFSDLVVRNFGALYVEGQLRRYAGRQVLDVTFIDDSVTSSLIDVVQLIPQSLCPLPKLLPYLRAAVRQITIVPLSDFVHSVLSDDGITFAYISVPASLNHHHNYPGGLLLHSLECFRMLARHNEFCREEQQLGLVAALFHDVGKILTLTHDMKRTSLGRVIDHDKLTLEVLSPYLRELDRAWTEGAAKLRYLLSWKLQQRIPRYDIADLITCYDRVSTGIDLKKRKLK